MGDKSCPFSVEEARSLTVPKLKAELIRLNQPISGLKRKAHYVEALTAIIEGRLPREHVTSPKTPAKDTPERVAKAKKGQKELHVDSADKGANKVSKLTDLDIADDPAKEGPNVAEADTVDSTTAADPQPHLEQPNESRGEGEHLDAATDNKGVDGEVNGMGEAHRVGGDPKPAPETEDNSSEAVQEPPIGPTSAPSPEEDVADVEGTGDRRSEHDGSQPHVQAETPSVKEPSYQVKMSGAEDIDMDSKPSNAEREEPYDQVKAMDVADDDSGTKSSDTPHSSRKSRKRTARVDRIMDGQVSSERGEGDNGGGDDADTIAAPSGGESGAGTPLEEPRTKRSRKSTSSMKDKNISEEIQEEAAMDVVAAPVTETIAGMDSEAPPESRAGGGGDNGGVMNDKVASGEDPTEGEEAKASLASLSPTTAVNEGEGTADPEATTTGETERMEDQGEEPARVTIRVDNFVRPFTAQQAKKLLEDKAGAPLVEGGFWMDSIKTHCYATFEEQAAADRAITALQGLQWPAQSFKRLEAKIGDVSAEEARARNDVKRTNRPGASTRPSPKLGPPETSTGLTTAAAKARAGANGTADDSEDGRQTVTVVRGRGSVQAPGVTGVKRGTWGANGSLGAVLDQEDPQQDAPIKLDEIFRKTDAKPALYWLPLTEEEVGERKKKMKEEGTGPRTTPMPADHTESSSGGGGRGAGVNGGSRGGGGSRRGYGGNQFSYRSDYSYGGRRR